MKSGQMRAHWRVAVLERSLAWLDRLAERAGRKPHRPAHLETGERGEDAAYFFLRRNGYTVVARRWSDGMHPGDLDLIAWQNDVLCFVEVKTRSSVGLVAAERAVDEDKRRILRRLAREYLRHLPEDAGRSEDSDGYEDFTDAAEIDQPQNRTPETRFDVIVVYDVPGKPRDIRLTAGAFSWTERRGRD
jgi:putative endonuclease